MVVYQRNPVGVELFHHVNTWVHVTYFAHKNLGKQNETTNFVLSFIQLKAALVLLEEKRAHNTQPNYSFLFVRNVVYMPPRY